MTDQPEGRALTMGEMNAQLRANRCGPACSEQHTYEPPCAATAPDLRDRLAAAIDTALGAGPYWLPADGRPTIVDAAHTVAAAAVEAERQRAEQAEAALARVRAIAEELAAHGAAWDGNEQGAGRRILNALKHRKEA